MEPNARFSSPNWFVGYSEYDHGAYLGVPAKIQKKWVSPNSHPNVRVFSLLRSYTIPPTRQVWTLKPLLKELHHFAETLWHPTYFPKVWTQSSHRINSQWFSQPSLLWWFDAPNWAKKKFTYVTKNQILNSFQNQSPFDFFNSWPQQDISRVVRSILLAQAQLTIFTQDLCMDNGIYLANNYI